MSMQQKELNRIQLALQHITTELKQVLKWLRKYQLPLELIDQILVQAFIKLYLLYEEISPEQEKELKPIAMELKQVVNQIFEELMKRW